MIHLLHYVDIRERKAASTYPSRHPAHKKQVKGENDERTDQKSSHITAT